MFCPLPRLWINSSVLLSRHSTVGQALNFPLLSLSLSFALLDVVCREVDGRFSLSVRLGELQVNTFCHAENFGSIFLSLSPLLV